MKIVQLFLYTSFSQYFLKRKQSKKKRKKERKKTVKELNQHIFYTALMQRIPQFILTKEQT